MKHMTQEEVTDRLDALKHEQRAEGITEEMLDYLDDLRESGDTNMFGAAPYVQSQFGLSKSEAREVVLYWMKTFPRAASE